MGTRSTYTFKDDNGEYTVYVHYDGYATGAAENLAATLASGKIWELPSFEADEFAAGFIAAIKERGGNVRLTTSPQQHADIEFSYTITQKDGELKIMVQSVNNWDGWQSETLWVGPLDEFIESAAENLE